MSYEATFPNGNTVGFASWGDAIAACMLVAARLGKKAEVEVDGDLYTAISIQGKRAMTIQEKRR